MVDRSRVADAYPISPSQAGLLFESLKAGEEPRHLEQYAYLLRGQLDSDRLRRAFESVVARHDALRSMLRWEKVETPLQIVLRAVDVPWAELDLRGLPSREQELRVDAFLSERRLEGIDPRRAPPLDVSLLRVEDNATWLVVGFHHALLDGWSYTQVLRETIAAYDHGGVAPPSLAPSQPYSRYIGWLKKRDGGGDEQFWRERLESSSEATPLGIDAERPHFAGPAFGELHEVVPAGLARRVQEIARTHRISEAALTVGAWALLLSRWSGSRDVLLGATMSGRPDRLPGASEIVGMFVATPPLRVCVPSTRPALEWLRDVHAEMLEVRQHQYTPLPDIRRQSGIAPGQALYESTVLHQSVPFVREGSRFGQDLFVERKKSFRSPGFPLGLMTLRDGERLECVIQYERARISDSFAAAIPAAWLGILAAIVAEPHIELRRVYGVPDEEKRRLLRLGAGHTNAEPEPLVIERVLEHARRRPHAVALSHGRVRLTYLELARRSAAVAARLGARGVGLESCVAIWSDRSADMVVAALGAMRAGAAYLPIDRAQPAERVAAMLEDASASLIVTDDPRGPEIGDSVELAGLGSHAVTSELPDVGGESVAYVIFTSGSSGRPKGVAVHHAGFSNTIGWRIRAAQLGPEDHGSHLVDTSFDAAVVETWEILAAGGTLHIVDDETRADAARLAEWFHEEGITSAHVIPALLRQMLEQRPDCFDGTRLVSVGGEQMRWEGFHRAPFRIFNQYGPTECSITALHAVVDPEKPNETIPLGRSIDGSRAYVVDSACQIAPLGKASELALGGIGVSRGYVGDPRRTADRFRPDPWAPVPGARLYLTGDIVRWREDEQLEFIGRADHQVKLRGRRVELGEIEDAALRFSGVEEACAHVHQDERGVKQLVMYVVGEAADSRALREHLRRHLPEHMIPTAWVAMRSLPRTRFGKVDRKELPAPSRPDLRRDAGAFDNEAEARVAQAFAQALGVEDVGPEDDFFALGGDSIVAMQVVWRIKKLGLHVSVQDVFDAPVVRALSMRASRGGETSTDSHEDPSGEIPLAPIQRWFFAQEFEHPDHFHQLMRVDMERDVDPTALRSALAEVVSHHPALRARFQQTKTGVRQWVVAGSAEPFAFESRSVNGGDERSLVDRLERSLSLGSGPVIACSYVRNAGGGQPRLWIVAHHLVVDAISWSILLDDLACAIRDIEDGVTRSLPRSASYAQATAAMVERSVGGDLDEERAYWQEVLRDATDPRREQVDPGTFAEAEVVRIRLPDETRRGLAAAAASGHSTEDVLLAALAKTWAECIGGERIIVELEASGRAGPLADSVDLGRTVGWLTVAHPLAIDLRRDADPEAWLWEVRWARRRVPADGSGYGLLHLLDDRTPWVRPDVVFNYLGSATELQMPGLGRASLNPFGLPTSGQNRRPAPFLIVAREHEEALLVEVSYTAGASDTEQPNRLLEQFQGALAEIVRALRGVGNRRAHALDFSLVQLDDATIAQLSRGRALEDILPLTSAQEGMLFHSRLSEETTGELLYREQFVHEVHGPVDPRRLERALEVLHERHAALRTEFHWHDLERPVQVVLREVTPRWSRLDLTDKTKAEAEAALERDLVETRVSPLQLDEAPVFHARLVTLPGGRTILVQNAHHAILDGWSAGVLLRELRIVYGDLVAGRPSTLPAAPPFSRFVEWLEGRDRARARRHFRDLLSDVQRPTPLGESRATGEPAPDVERRVRHPLHPDLSRRLRVFTRSQGVTLATLAAAGWALTLRWVSGEDAPVFGLTTAGRPAELPELRATVGLFINTLPARVRVPRDTRVIDWLRSVQESIAEHRRHEHLPLVEAERASGVTPGRSLFDSILVVEMTAAEEDSSSPLRFEPIASESRLNYPVVVTVHAQGASHVLELLVHPDRVGPAQARQLASCLASVIEQLVAAPASGVSEVSPWGWMRGRDLESALLATEARLRGASPPTLEDWRPASKGAASLRFDPEAFASQPSWLVSVALALGRTLARGSARVAVAVATPRGTWPLTMGLRRSVDRAAADVRAQLDTIIDGHVGLPSAWWKARAMGGGSADWLRVVIQLPGSEPWSGSELVVVPQRDEGSGAWCLALRAESCPRGGLQRFAEQLECALQGTRAAGDGLTEALPVVPRSDLRALASWNRTETVFAPPYDLVRLFEARVDAQPDEVALVSDDGATLTYSELDRRANGVAHALQQLGVGVESRVGVFLRRSFDLLIAVHGVIKAGASYVPLDPALPSERLHYMIEDANMSAVISHPASAGPEFPCPELRIDAVGGASRLTVRAHSDNEAYMIYTSGSTGRPKGVSNVHRGIANRLRWMQSAFPIGLGDVVVHKTPFSFDVSVWELFWPLHAGARLLVARDEGHKDPEYLAELLERFSVSTIHFVPSMLDAFLFHLEHSRRTLPGLRRVICSGEALSADLLVRSRRALSGAEVHNLYGPTEAAVDVSWWAAGPEQDLDTIPIGRPIANTTLHVVDVRLEPVPIETSGELAIGGVQVSRGYHGRPALTAERFRPDPLGLPGARLYLTGDACAWSKDGQIEYHGRLDNQIKLRGLRIELGEVEVALERCVSIRRAVASVRGETLVAHVVAGDGFDQDQVRTELQRFLPEYMVPTRIIVLPSLPLTPSGKVDRGSLPETDLEPEGGAGLELRDESERNLAAAWQAVLGVDVRDRNANFFRLGGHSLAAARLVTRVHRDLGARLRLADVFEHPRLDELAAVIRSANARSSDAPKPHTRSDEPARASFSQRRLWVLDQMLEDRTAYHVPLLLRLRGRLKAEAIRQAIGSILERQDVLRTRFLLEGDELKQVVERRPADVVTVCLAEAEDPERALDRAVQAAVRRPFDLMVGPLFRAHLFELGPTEHALLVVAHHTVTDGGSNELFMDELRTAYAKSLGTGTSPVEPLPLRYADYAEWQRSWMMSNDATRELEFWRAELEGAPAQLELPADFPRDKPVGGRSGMSRVVVPRDLWEAVETCARQLEVTPFAVVLAAFKLVLARQASASDVVVGMPTSGRDIPELASLMGLFVNSLVLRTQVRLRESFEALVRRVHDTVARARAHARVPFERLVQELAPERHTTRTPLFQVMVVWNEASESRQEWAGGLVAERWPTPVGAAQMELSLHLVRDPDGLSGAISYDAERFSPATVEYLAGHLRSVLERATRSPRRQVGSLPMWKGEEEKVVAASAGATVKYAPPHTLVEIWRAAAREHAARIALRGPDGRTLSYGRLAARARGVALRLRELGVGPESLVGIHIERSIDLLVAVYGVLEAGAAYVPLEPGLPQDRLSFMAADCGASVILVSSDTRVSLERAGVVRVDVSHCPPDASGRELSPPSPWQAAYAIYTSGSTGTPKGAVNANEAVVNRLRWMQGAFPIGPGDVLVQKTPFSFDVSVWELFWPLQVGATLAIANPDQHRDPSALAELLREEGVSTVHFVPSMLEAFVHHLESRPTALPSLRRIICSGEALKRELVDRTAECLPGVNLENLYGPTEAAVDVTYWRCSTGDSSARVPIGTPIANTRVFVADDALSPAPVTVPGELCIAGIQVARGYLRRPALTADRFRPDPGGKPGERLYRTGDFCRVRPDAAIDYLGRMDSQVKLRGFRIELGEIEAALESVEGVRAAAAVLLGQGLDARICGYFVGAAAPDIVRAALLARLPDYMLPSALVRLGELPKTPSGKVDRRALPAPRFESVSHEAPVGATENALAAMWRELLSVEGVGREDDFFALGGHSLLAAQLVARARERWQVDIDLRTVFEVPRLADLAVRVDRASRQSLPTLRARDWTGPAPASFSQERLWFLHRLEPETAAYNIVEAFRLEGSVDEAALRVALQRLVQRHETLRTRFSEGAHGLTQHPLAEVEPLVFWHEATGETPEARFSDAKRFVVEQCELPFDLSTPPLLRLAVARVDDGHHLLGVSMHHAVGDGWSNGILVRELTELYLAQREARAPRLEPLPVQYRDYAVWQRECLDEEALGEQLAEWRRVLGDAEPVMDLPLDRPRPPVKVGSAGTVAFEIPASVGAAVELEARSSGTTPFNVLLAAWNVVLASFSCSDDVIVGTPISGRSATALEGLIGCFVNTLVLRTPVDRSRTFRDLVRTQTEVVLDAQDRGDVPFEKIVADLDVTRDPSTSPVFQVMFSFHDEPLASRRVLGALAERVEIPPLHAKFDLTLTLVRRPEGILGRLEFDESIFERSTVDAYVSQYVRVLESGTADPSSTLSKIDRPSGTELDRVTLAWARGPALAREGTSAGCVPALVAAQARTAPERTALSCGARRVSYAELISRVNAGAAFLHASGVGPGDRVLLCLTPGIDYVVSALATMTTGAAYVSVDASYPRERIAFMVEDSRASLVIAEEHEREFGGGCRVVSPERLSAEGPLGRGPTVRDEAYVIYTSGTTGVPKGVSVPHRGLVALCRWHQRTYELGPGDAVSQIASVGFDASVWEIWPTLVAGATLHIATGESRRDPSALCAFLQARAIAVGFVSTPVVEALLDLPEARELPARTLLTGGDRLRRVDLSGAPFRLVNHYGPTENTVVSTAGVVRSQVSPTIGKPLPNTAALVLDDTLEPKVAGAPGELCVGGAQVADGYVGRPALTADRFRPDAFGEAGDRLYRTGDLVRWTSSGELVFMGRLDRQVKLRGQRVELGEIESALERCSGVERAVVDVRRNAAGAELLVGWVVALEEVDVAALRVTLAERLPPHMVPQALVRLDELPLTAHGKVDRRGLAVPPVDVRADRELPATETELALATVWSDVLGLDESPRRDDDFFLLGGHSLLATRLASRVREELSVELPLRTVFEASSLEAMAARVDRLHASRLPEIRARASRADAIASFAQERLWFLQRMRPESAAYNIPIVLRLSGALDVCAMEAAVAGLVARHEVLRTRLLARDDGVVQKVDDMGPSMQTVHLDDPAQASERVRRLVAVPFDLERDHPVRFTLLRGAEEHWLVMVLHHVAGDGWSAGVVLRELEELYRAYHEHREAELAPLPVQYADYAAWQRSWLSGAELERQLAHWRQRLDPVPPDLDLPTDSPRPSLKGDRGGLVRVKIDEETTRRLEALASKERGTLFMVLMAAWQAVLSHFTRGEDIVVGTPVAGRRAAQLEGLIGFFVNTLVLRSRVTPELPFIELLRRVREDALAAFDNQDLPFELLVAEVAPRRDPSRTPLFQAMFSLQSESLAATRFPGLSATLVRPEEVSAKFDLSLALVHGDGRVEGALVYDAALFSAPTAARISDAFCVFLRAVASTPAAPLWRGFERDPAQESTAFSTLPVLDATWVDERIEHWVERTPSAVALVGGDRQVTYRELWRRAGSVARVLIRAGVRADDCVGVLASRTIETVVAMLAVMRAGAAYVPLDPEHPSPRLEEQLSSTGASVVVGLRDTLERTGLLGRRSLALDEVDVAAMDVAPLRHGAALLYVTFTSGSSGQPKGIAVEHRSMLSYLAGLGSRIDLVPGKKHAVLTTLAADVGNTAVYGALTSGGVLHLVEADVVKSPRRLADYVRRFGIDFLKSVPPHIETMLATDVEILPREALILGGEVLPWSLAQAVTRRRRCALFNSYGPSETTVAVAMERVETHEGASVPVGAPIGGARLAAVDTLGFPTPANVPGELWIGGPGVSRGYVGRPRLTAERFVPDPLADRPGSRAYRSGDLVRMLGGGRYEFLGRIDAQIKIRGFRVEPGEVEVAVRRLASVKAAVVVARSDAERGVHLVAYVVSREEHPSGVRDAAELEKLLPAYMIPSAWVYLERLPLTGNNKVDRRALPAPVWHAARDTVPPRTHTERAIAAAFEHVLRLSNVDRESDFFLLGGHSLLAVSLVAQIERNLGTRVELLDVFQRRTVAALAARVDQGAPAGRSEIWSELASGAGPEVLAMHGLSGRVTDLLALAGALDGRLAVAGLTADSGLDQMSLAELARHHTEEIRERRGQGPFLILAHSAGAFFALEVARALLGDGLSAAVCLLDPPPFETRADAVDEVSIARKWGTEVLAAAGRESESWRLAGASGEAATLRALADAGLGAGAEEGRLLQEELRRYARLFACSREARVSGPRVPHSTVILASEGNGRSGAARAVASWLSVLEEPSTSVVEATHFGMLKAPAVARVADLVARWSVTTGFDGKAGS